MLQIYTDAVHPKVHTQKKNIKRVRESVAESKDIWLRKKAQELCFNKDFLRKIIIKNLRLKPYKIQFTQVINEIDTTQKLTYAEKLESIIHFLSQK